MCFLVEFDLLFAFSVLSLDCASLFIYVHEHDRLCFPMSTEEKLYLIAFADLVPVAKEKVSLIRWNTVWNRWKSTLSARSIRVNLNHGKRNVNSVYFINQARANTRISRTEFI